MAPPAPPPPSLPPTLLPTDPSSLTKYLQSHQLIHLRTLFEQKVILVASQLEEEAQSRRGRRGRQRRRQGASPGPSPLDDDVEEEEDLLARKKLKVSVDEAHPIDRAHAYELVYDLAPNGSADTYYHGPHPAPPAKVVRSLIRAVRLPPLFDPAHLSATQLYGAAQDLWEAEGTRAIGMSLERERAEAERESQAEIEEDWEAGIIAAFSAECDAKISKSIRELPPSQRPVFVEQVPQPGPMRQASPFQDSERYGGPQGGYWRW
jgi:hypothetical protein